MIGMRNLDANLKAMIGPNFIGDDHVLCTGGTNAYQKVKERYATDKIHVSWDEAWAAVTANQGDRIIVAPQTALTVSAAGAMAADKAGIHLIGIGWGSLQPTITLDTAHCR